jgi:hypothetical protein
MSQNQLSGLLGSVLLFAGLFTPIFSSPIKGQLNYFQYNQVEAAILLLVAALALTFSLARKYQVLLFVGLAALGALAFTFLKFYIYTSGGGDRWLKKFSDSPFEGINRLVQQTFSLDWGWALLLVGAVLVLAASSLKGYSGGRER